jgi:hypothetical protein
VLRFASYLFLGLPVFCFGVSLFVCGFFLFSFFFSFVFALSRLLEGKATYASAWPSMVSQTPPTLAMMRVVRPSTDVAKECPLSALISVVLPRLVLPIKTIFTRSGSGPGTLHHGNHDKDRMGDPKI